MSNHSIIFKWPYGEAGGFATLQHELQRLWQRLPAGVRAPGWPVILAVLIVVMLLTFHQVVRGAVEQSALRHKAEAMRTEFKWDTEEEWARAASRLLTTVH